MAKTVFRVEHFISSFVIGPNGFFVSLFNITDNFCFGKFLAPLGVYLNKLVISLFNSNLCDSQYKAKRVYCS